MLEESYFWAIRSDEYMKFAGPLLREERNENRELILNHYFFTSMDESQKNEIINVIFTKVFKIGARIASEG